MGPVEGERETQEQLQKHVANNLYFLFFEEWHLGVDKVKIKFDERKKKRNALMLKMVRKVARFFAMTAVKVAFTALTIAFTASGIVYSRVMRMLGRDEPQPTGTMKAVAPNNEELEDDGVGGRSKESGTQRRINALQDKFTKMFSATDAISMMEGRDDEEEQRAHQLRRRLDETHLGTIVDEDEEGGDPAGGGGGAVSSTRIRDDMFGSLSIDDYMDFRAKPLCAYLENTAPWRGFWMQVLEVMIFFFSSLGAVLVGVEATPFVALTVAAASITTSFMEFSNIRKQVEAYNQAVNSMHTMMNEWDGMTRTTRRTRQTITKVVSTVEGAMEKVAYALTDALPTGSDEGDGDGDGDGES